MKFPRSNRRSREERSQSVTGVLLDQHSVAAALRELADVYASLDDLQGSMAMHAAANGFESGKAVPGVGFVLGQGQPAGLSDPRKLDVGRTDG